ncbi:hypothetical protein MLD38_013842 [Melastoma candidum]|uniref:Uncharacterized protein n=1 Tax=Melastoma candidum TaxID=119954 RepID=A0ACB9RAY1_9MYRT|nr:hypothetical protein MLD38_013842 [Melastoma candidum]
MKSTTAFAALFVLSFVLLSARASHARGNPDVYWKEVMKDQPMPDALKDIVAEDGIETARDFVKDFDVRQSAIIYHGREEDVKEHANVMKPSGV